MLIRENIEQHLAELNAWLATVQDEPPERMDAFFTARIDDYEEHMQIWAEAYRRFAQLLPPEPGKVLDLGVGTGLELDEIWAINPAISVTGVDMSQAMLDLLYRKICRGLRPGGCLLLGDYIACCEEEETLLRDIYLEKRKRYAVPDDQFIHFDIPMTLEHETAILREAGFQIVEPLDSIAGATILSAVK